MLRFAKILFQCVIIAMFLVAGNVHAQSWGWLISAGGDVSDKATDIDIDNNGNQYVCGYYNSGTSGNDVSFGAISPIQDFGKEGFLAKVDTAGNWLWVQSAPGGWDERVLGMCVDRVNNYVYATGTCWYNTTFGGCTSTVFPGGGDNIFISKFDLSGNCQWMVGCGGTYDDHGFDVVTDKPGNIYVTGFVGDTYGAGGLSATFGPINIPIPIGDSLGFVAKLDPAGNFQWVRTFQATDGERDNRIAIDSLANVYIVGGFWGTKPFGSLSATSNGGRDIFVIKYDNAGNLIWLRTTGSTLDDRANSVCVDKYENVYVTGEFRDKVIFGTDTLNNNGGPGGRDVFVARMSNTGNWIWASKGGSNAGSDRGNRITSNQQGTLFVTGQYKGNASFGPHDIFNTTDSVEIFVAAIDTAGKWKWALPAGGTKEDRGNGIVADDSCNLYTTGFYQSSCDFGAQNLTALGRKDIYVAKIYNACVTVTPPPPPPPPPPSVAECDPNVPNIFSPNHDNINEELLVEGTCISELTLSIFNRWGKEIYTFDTPDDKWNGTINGKPASEGVYYYIGEMKLDNGDTEKLKGFITLVR